MYLLMSDQFLAPNRSTSRVRIRSSSALHGPLIFSGLFTSLGALAPFNEESDDDESDEVFVDKHKLNGSIRERERARERWRERERFIERGRDFLREICWEREELSEEECWFSLRVVNI